ncbi:MAG TPA: hypothetical protein VJ302_00980 [Blastocatellia bacterium]|nr:hypothetical protein [Blastocatellia bacterium]
MICLIADAGSRISHQAYTGAQPHASPEQAGGAVGNTIYNLSVDAAGRYTATTGPAHPAGPGRNLLFNLGTTFNTVRSYTTNTDYAQRVVAEPPPSSSRVLSLAQYASNSPLGTTGIRTTYVLPGPPATPDAMTITQDVNVNGTTFDDSTIEVTTSVVNNGASPLEVGIRYLWDYQIGADDGPTLQELGPDGMVRTTETEFPDPKFSQYRIVDNDGNASSPTFFTLGTAFGPMALKPLPTAPDLLQFVSWPRSNVTSFDYAVNPNLPISGRANCAECDGGDSAVIYYFGRDRANSLKLPVGGKATVSASMFLMRPVNTDLAVTQTASPNPVTPGSNLTYRINVANRDPETAARFVTLTSDLTAGATAISCAATGGGICGGTGNNRVVAFPSLAPGASEQVTIVATANCEGGGSAIVNRVAVSSSAPDRNPADNAAATGLDLAPVTGSLVITGGRSAIDFGTVTAGREPSANPPSETFTIENRGCATALLGFTLNRTGAEVGSGKLLDSDDSALFPILIADAGGNETPLPVGPGAAAVSIPGGQSRRFRVRFNPLIPLVSSRNRGLLANQVLPPVLSSRLTIAPPAGAPLTIDLKGRVTTAARLIHPIDLRRAPLVAFTRSGDQFEVEYSVYDPNLDLNVVRYQFLDQAGGAVGLPIDAAPGPALAQANLVMGQSVTVAQRFTGAARQPRIAGVRVTVFDQESNDTAASAALGVMEARVVSVSAASFGEPVACESIVAAFGTNLATGTAGASSPQLPTSLAGTRVLIRDGQGIEREAPLFFVSPRQINYQIPPGTRPGAATVSVIRGQELASLGLAQVAGSAPGLFSADATGRGLAAAQVFRIGADGRQRYEPAVRFDAARNGLVAVPIGPGSPDDQVFLVLYGTGLRYLGARSGIGVKVGGIEVPVLYAGAQGELVGLDQVNVPLPRSLYGRGEVEVVLTGGGATANPVKIQVGGALAAAGSETVAPAGKSLVQSTSEPGAGAIVILPTLKVSEL